MSWINNKEAKLVTKPFKHACIDNFLDDSKLQEVFTQLQTLEFYEKESDLFKLKQTDDFASVEHGPIQDLREFLSGKEFVEFIEKITKTKLQIGIVDVAGTCYEDTDFLLLHDDQLDNRKIAFLLYLSDMDEGEGGALELYDNEKGKPTKITKTIIPKVNRLAFFEVSKKSFHEVSEVIVPDKQRLAIGGWLHGRN